MHARTYTLLCSRWLWLFQVHEHNNSFSQVISGIGRGPVALHFNLSAICPPNSSISELTYTSDGLHSAVVSQPHKTLMMVLKKNYNLTEMTVSVSIRAPGL
jgi:hypothetical protein